MQPGNRTSYTYENEKIHDCTNSNFTSPEWRFATSQYKTA